MVRATPPGRGDVRDWLGAIPARTFLGASREGWDPTGGGGHSGLADWLGSSRSGLSHSGREGAACSLSCGHHRAGGCERTGAAERPGPAVP